MGELAPFTFPCPINIHDRWVENLSFFPVGCWCRKVSEIIPFHLRYLKAFKQKFNCLIALDIRQKKIYDPHNCK